MVESRDSTSSTSLMCAMLVLLLLFAIVFIPISGRFHLYVIGARYDNKQIEVSYCATKNPLNLSKIMKKLMDEKPRTIYETIFEKPLNETFPKIFDYIISEASNESGSCPNRIPNRKTLYSQLPEDLWIASISYGDPNGIYFGLSPQSPSNRTISSSEKPGLLITSTDITPLLSLDIFVFIILLLSNETSPGRFEKEPNHYTYKRLLALSYTSILLLLKFILLLLSYFQITTSLLIITLALIVPVAMLILYSVSIVIGRYGCNLHQRLKAKSGKTRWFVKLVEILFPPNFCINIVGDDYKPQPDRYTKLIDRSTKLVAGGILIIFTISIMYYALPSILDNIFTNQAGTASSQGLSGIVALTIAVIYTVPFTLLNMTSSEAIRAAYDALLLIALMISMLEIITFLAIFKLIFMITAPFVAISFLLCYQRV